MSRELRCGLVLEGGAMRGMYTAGVLDTFMEMGITMDSVVGVSAGALFGVNYLSGQKGRAIRYNKKYNRDPHYLGVLPLLKEGNIVSTEYAYHRVPCELDPFDNDTFQKAEAEFYAVITNMINGEAEYVQITDIFEQMDTLRASGSMPYVSTPVIINDTPYMDGAVTDNIPFEWMSTRNVDRMVVVLTRDISYKKRAMSKLLTNGMYKKKYPKFAASLIKRHLRYAGQIADLRKLEDEGSVFVIRPSRPIRMSRIERKPEKLQEAYELGIKDAKDCMDRLKSYLAGNDN